MALLDEERLVVTWLSQYGALPKGMITRLLYYKSSDTVGRILMGLKRRRYITQLKDSQYYAIDRFCEPKPRMIAAIWVLLEFITQIDPFAHSQADRPSQIFFLKEKTAYEILVLYEEEDHLVRLLQPQEGTKYIIVIPNLEFADKLILPDAPCLFATLEPTNREAPKVTFYSA